jgi:transposase-like protein
MGPTLRCRDRSGSCYRAVDSAGQTIDFLLTGKRDTAAAKRFFQRGLAIPVFRYPE